MFDYITDYRKYMFLPLLENHVLTVLSDIRHKRLSGYGKSFSEALGTERQTLYVHKLEQDIRKWLTRLDTYLQTAFVQGKNGSPAVRIANKMHEDLSNAIKPESKNENCYYRMLRTVISIQENAGEYLQQIENSGDMDPAIALFVAYLKNYDGIAKDFNNRFASLPELYSKEVLHALPAKAVPDRTYLIIYPSDTGNSGFTMEKGTAFAAGDDLTYKTEQEEYISLMQCVSVLTTYRDESALYLQTLDHANADDAETLFADGKKMQCGWLIESPMLVMEEGWREVTIGLQLKEGNKPHDNGNLKGFIVQISTEEGWTSAETECGLSSEELRFCCRIGRDDNTPSACTEETHGMETVYPAIRIMTDNESYPIWAEELVFESVRIEVYVRGISDFTFMNELGETNTTQPLSPFGIQAERGAWFQFGLEEANLKPLKEVTLTGNWQNIPDTKNGIDQLYKDYPGVDASSFNIRTDRRKDGNWIRYGDGKPLFDFDNAGRLQNAVFCFHADNPDNGSVEDGNGLFRITLDSPDIGFGAAAYRNRFTEVMVHNSRCKKKDMWELPQEPPLPQLTDMELTYRAEIKAQIKSNTKNVKIRPIILADGTDVPPQVLTERMIPQLQSHFMLYFAFTGATDEQKIRMYLDMTTDKASFPDCSAEPDCSTVLAWSYWNGTAWTRIPSKNVTAEETDALTRSGFIEIEMEEKIREEWTDQQGRLWIRAAFMQWGRTDKPAEDKPSTLSVRGVWTNCISVIADGGDGEPLNAGTIQGTEEEDTRIESVVQPLHGYGGRQAETETQCADRQKVRIHNRHRAVTAQDYEEILMEHFPETDKVRCFTAEHEYGGRKIFITVFSRTEDNTYFLSPSWKLAEMERTIRRYASPFARLEVINPVYERTDVRIKVRLHDDVEDEGKVIRQLIVLTQDYIAPWMRKGEIPEPGLTCYMQALRSRLVNHEDVEELLELTVCVVNGTQGQPERDDDEKICGRYPWSILLPRTEIELLPYQSGIEEAEIEGNFTIN